MKVLNYEIFEIHAEFCRTLASPKRLIILSALENREMSVGELSELLETSLATTSQHLKVLRDKEIVKIVKKGQKVYYHLNDPEIVSACNKIREIILKINIAKRNMMLTDLDLEHLIKV